ncbi:MAG: glycosyltransferase family 2 protein [Phocaeicola sp.]
MKYSITIPAYKAAFLEECIESILAQTDPDFELIIVNDASPEDLDSIVSKFNDVRIRYYTNKENCGMVHVVDNWNISLSYARGDYMICMGDDDLLTPTCLEEYNRLMDRYPNLDIYHARAKIINEKSEIIDYQEPRPEYESVYSMIYYRLKGRIQFIGDFLFKTSTLRANGGFYKLPLAWGSDEVSAYIAATERGIANTMVATFGYRVNSFNITNGGNYSVKVEAMKEEVKWFTHFLDNHTPLNELDSFYYAMIKRLMPLYFKRAIFNTITMDVKMAPLQRLPFWVSNYKREGLTGSQLVKLVTRMFSKRKNYI